MSKFMLKTVLLLFAVCFLTAGCGNVIVDDSKENQSSNFDTAQFSLDETEKNAHESSIGSVLSETDEYKPFNFGMAINVCHANENGGVGEPMQMKTSIEDKQEVRLNTIIRVSPDSSLKAEVVPVKLFVIADGKMIPFSINGNSEYYIQGETEIPPNNEASVPISFEGNSDMYLISIVVCSFPEIVPGLRSELFSGVGAYTFVNTACRSKALKYKVTDIENYVKVGASNENIGIGVDTKSLAEEQNAQTTQYDEDFILSKAKDDLWLKFNEDSPDKNGLPLNIYYSVLVLCDGEPIRMFGGEYTHIVYTPSMNPEVSSSSAFQYAIPKELIPDDGLHIFQCIAVPCYVKDAENQITSSGVYGLGGISSNKIRVLIKE